jgi:hypothetical protein
MQKKKVRLISSLLMGSFQPHPALENKVGDLGRLEVEVAAAKEVKRYKIRTETNDSKCMKGRTKVSIIYELE